MNNAANPGTVSVFAMGGECILGQDVFALLEQAGCVVAGRMDNGGEPLALIKESRPDVVLMGVDQGGRDAALELGRRIEKECAVPLVIVPAPDVAEDFSAMQISGVLLLLPCTLDGFRLAIEKALRLGAEKRLQQCRERARIVLEHLPGVGVFAGDEQGRVALLNCFLREVFGWKDGAPGDFRAAMSMIVADCGGGWEARRILEEGGGDYSGVEVEGRDASGRKRTFMLSDHSRRHPVPGWSSWGVAVDITRRKALERELARRNELLQSAMTAGRMCAWEADLETWTFNHSRYLRALLHLGADDPSDRVEDWTARIPQPHRGQVEDGFAKVRDGSVSARDLEYPFLNGEGKVVWLRTTGRVDDSPRGTVFVGITREITERVRARQVREDVERLVRHDLRSPLNGLQGLAQILLLEDLPPEQAKLVREMQGCSERMLQLIDFSLELHKLEDGSYTPPAKAVDVVPVLRWAMRNAKMQAAAKEVGLVLRIEVSCHSSAGLVRGERVLLENMFSNLITNAVEASPRGRDVRISLAAGLNEIRVEIRNAQCVPCQVRERFFEKYATYGKTRGTGLGTYSARLIARAHGGDVAMETSDPENKTTLAVILPAY